MSVLVEFSLPAESFVFGSVASREPSVRVELDRQVPLGVDECPHLWMQNADRDAFERHARRDPSIASIEFVETGESGSLYRIRWDGRVKLVLRGISESDASILRARLVSERWLFRLRFPDAGGVKRFQQFCIEHEIPTNVSRVAAGSDFSRHDEYELTEKQWIALRTAYERGYFDQPRRTDLEALGEELGVSSQAVSQRLRRAIERLIEHALASAETGT